jgi:hypothetical protein
MFGSEGLSSSLDRQAVTQFNDFATVFEIVCKGMEMAEIVSLSCMMCCKDTSIPGHIRAARYAFGIFFLVSQSVEFYYLSQLTGKQFGSVEYKHAAEDLLISKIVAGSLDFLRITTFMCCTGESYKCIHTVDIGGVGCFRAADIAKYIVAACKGLCRGKHLEVKLAANVIETTGNVIRAIPRIIPIAKCIKKCFCGDPSAQRQRGQYPDFRRL